MHWRHCAHAQRQGPPSRSLSSSHRAESGTVALPGYLPRKGNHEPTGHDLDKYLDHTTMIGRSVLTSIDKVTDNHHYSHMNTSVVSTLHIKVHPTTVSNNGGWQGASGRTQVEWCAPPERSSSGCRLTPATRPHARQTYGYMKSTDSLQTDSLHPTYRM